MKNGFLPRLFLHGVASGMLTGLIACTPSIDQRGYLSDPVIERGLNVREAEALARQSAGPKGAARPAAAKRGKDADTQALENDLAEALGLHVEVIDKGGQGELRVRYATLEQLDDLCRRLSRA